MLFNWNAKHNTTSICSNIFQAFCVFWLLVLHMMPLRAISQYVRFQPHCSNSLFNIKKHKKWKRMRKHASQFKHKTQCCLNLFKCFWHFLCFLNDVSMHMMPFRAISQPVRVQPHCSDTLFNIKRHQKWKRMLKHVFQFKHKAQ